jgi:sec-independent protein translocase protein TatB
MGGLDPAKILMVLLVAVIVIGPERLPKAARQLGAFWHELTRIRERLEDEVRTALPDLDLPKIPAMPRGGITGYLTGMMTSVGNGAGGASKASGAVTGEIVTGSSAGEGAVARTAGGFSNSEWAPALGSGGAASAGSGATISSAALSSGGLPAGWQSAGAPSPGFASGSLLSPVPSGPASGPFTAEIELSPDEPSWN